MTIWFSGNEEVDGVADESRDKRYSGFGSSSSDGGDAEGHAGSGGSGGGSGNFLFDIIRVSYNNNPEQFTLN